MGNVSNELELLVFVVILPYFVSSCSLLFSSVLRSKDNHNELFFFNNSNQYFPRIYVFADKWNALITWFLEGTCFVLVIYWLTVSDCVYGFSSCHILSHLYVFGLLINTHTLIHMHLHTNTCIYASIKRETERDRECE